MNHVQLFSRRDTPRKADFRPDADGNSPYAQLRRLSAYLGSVDTPPREDITDCPDALAALREYTYRKIFTAVTHDEFVKDDKNNPEMIDWLIAVHGAETAAHQSRKQTR